MWLVTGAYLQNLIGVGRVRRTWSSPIPPSIFTLLPAMEILSWLVVPIYLAVQAALGEAHCGRGAATIEGGSRRPSMPMQGSPTQMQGQTTHGHQMRVRLLALVSPVPGTPMNVHRSFPAGVSLRENSVLRYARRQLTAATLGRTSAAQSRARKRFKPCVFRGMSQNARSFYALAASRCNWGAGILVSTALSGHLAPCGQRRRGRYVSSRNLASATRRSDAQHRLVLRDGPRRLPKPKLGAGTLCPGALHEAWPSVNYCFADNEQLHLVQALGH